MYIEVCIWCQLKFEGHLSRHRSYVFFIGRIEFAILVLQSQGEIFRQRIIDDRTMRGLRKVTFK